MSQPTTPSSTAPQPAPATAAPTTYAGVLKDAPPKTTGSYRRSLTAGPAEGAAAARKAAKPTRTMPAPSSGRKSQRIAAKRSAVADPSVERPLESCSAPPAVQPQPAPQAHQEIEMHDADVPRADSPPTCDESTPRQVGANNRFALLQSPAPAPTSSQPDLAPAAAVETPRGRITIDGQDTSNWADGAPEFVVDFRSRYPQRSATSTPHLDNAPRVGLRGPGQVAYVAPLPDGTEMDLFPEPSKEDDSPPTPAAQPPSRAPSTTPPEEDTSTRPTRTLLARRAAATLHAPVHTPADTTTAAAALYPDASSLEIHDISPVAAIDALEDSQLAAWETLPGPKFLARLFDDPQEPAQHTIIASRINRVVGSVTAFHGAQVAAPVTAPTPPPTPAPVVIHIGPEPPNHPHVPGPPATLPRPDVFLVFNITDAVDIRKNRKSIKYAYRSSEV